MRKQDCLVCGLCGRALCRACQASYDKATKRDDGSILAIIQWAADRARAAERERAKKLTDSAAEKWGAATQLQESFEAVLKTHLNEKMTRLDAALRAVRQINTRDTKRKGGER